MKHYNLYCGKLQDIKNNDEQRVFYNSTKHYLLVFASETPKGIFTLVPEKHYNELSHEESVWLTGCKIWANGKYIMENSEEMSESLERFTSALEQELKAEIEKQTTTTT